MIKDKPSVYGLTLTCLFVLLGDSTTRNKNEQNFIYLENKYDSLVFFHRLYFPEVSSMTYAFFRKTPIFFYRNKVNTTNK